MDNDKQSSSKSILEKLKERWEVKSGWQVLIILMVFALTGMSIVQIKKWLFLWIGFDENTMWYYKLIVWIFAILPLYQVVLIAYGTIFGQYRFFSRFVAKMIYRIFPFLKK